MNMNVVTIFLYTYKVLVILTFVLKLAVFMELIVKWVRLFSHYGLAGLQFRYTGALYC